MIYTYIYIHFPSVYFLLNKYILYISSNDAILGDSRQAIYLMRAYCYLETR